MNLFQKYGIKEVADVVFYSINRIGDEEFYTPVLFLDTLKISNLDKTAEKVTANGGYGNKKLITWNFGKQITLKLEDALFSPASMSMIWGGRLNSKLSAYTSAIVKINIANKHGALHYSTKAYPSPALTDEEWEIVFEVAEEKEITTTADDVPPVYTKGEQFAAENRANLIKFYFTRGRDNEEERAMPTSIVEGIRNKITSLDKLGKIETDIYDFEVIDRMEKIIVKNDNGLAISTKEQRQNLFKHYADDRTSSYTIYYDAKTMLPLFDIKEGFIQEDAEEDHVFKVKKGTILYKATRTVKYKESEEDDSILGKTLVIDADTFPDNYKIVGETYIREQKTGKDQRYQFVINRATVTTDTSITLQADGDPTTFSMSIDVLTPPNDIMMELKQFDVEEDVIHGGTSIVPQKGTYTYTPTNYEYVDKVSVENGELY